jgi:hypothetical protein
MLVINTGKLALLIAPKSSGILCCWLSRTAAHQLGSRASPVNIEQSGIGFKRQVLEKN